jgi:hypothetical protein
MIGKVLWTEFFSNRDWPVAAAVAVAMLVLLLVPLLLFQRSGTRGRGGRPMTRPPPLLAVHLLAFGYAFLYIPILSLIVYSFNESRLVTVWGGFSTKWYGSCSATSRYSPPVAVGAGRGHERHLRRDARHARGADPGALHALSRPPAVHRDGRAHRW